VTWLAVGAVVAAAVLIGRHGVHSALSASPLSSTDQPPAGVEEASHRLDAPPTAPAGQGGYAFERKQPQSDKPVTWDPCRPLHYVIAGRPPEGGQELVDTAVAQLSAATGLRFVDDGHTNEQLNSAARAPYQPATYGRRWAPIIIDWTSPDKDADLAGMTIGLGAGAALSGPDGRSTYVTGTVALDVPQIVSILSASDLAGDRRGRGLVSAVVMHELGHVLGLAHVDDPAQVMYPEAQLQVTKLGNGDKRGLALLGSGRCEPRL
jgi:hypothetical protein